MNIEEIVEKIGVEKLAIAAANENLPPTKSTKPDYNEDHIRESLINSLYGEIKDINSKIDGFKILIAEKIEASKKSIEIASKAAKNFSHAASTLKTQKLTDLERLKSELKTKKHDLELFKNKHHLERSASYPPSQIYIGGVLAMLLLIESVFNGFVFSEALPGGLVAGVSLAFLIAFINVIPAFMIGKFIYIQIWYISKFRKIACTLLSVIWLIFTLLWNLFVAYVRDHMDLEKSLGSNFLEAGNFFSDPPASMFEISSLNSWLLLFLGFLFAIIALIDGVNSDDHYFGYGKVDRQIKEIDEEISYVRKDLTDSIDELKESYDKELSVEALTVKTSKNITENHHASRDMLIRSFEDDVNSVKGQAKVLIKKYRSVNAKKREDDPPKFFDKEPAALVFKKREFIKINIEDLDIDPKNTFIDAKLSIAKKYDQLNTEIDEKT